MGAFSPSSFPSYNFGNEGKTRETCYEIDLLPILYLLSGVFIAPGAALAYFICSVEQAARTQNLIKLFSFVLIRMCQTLDWVMFIVAPALIVWLVLAFMEKYRWIGAGGMGLTAVATLVGFVATSRGSVNTATEGGPFTFAVVLGLGICVWIAWDGGAVAVIKTPAGVGVVTLGGVLNFGLAWARIAQSPVTVWQKYFRD